MLLEIPHFFEVFLLPKSCHMQTKILLSQSKQDPNIVQILQ